MAEAVSVSPTMAGQLLEAPTMAEAVSVSPTMAGQLSEAPTMAEAVSVSPTMAVSSKLLGLISCENLWLLIARHSALQERGANDQVIRSLA